MLNLVNENGNLKEAFNDLKEKTREIQQASYRADFIKESQCIQTPKPFSQNSSIATNTDLAEILKPDNKLSQQNSPHLSKNDIQVQTESVTPKDTIVKKYEHDSEHEKLKEKLRLEVLSQKRQQKVIVALTFIALFLNVYLKVRGT